MHVNPSRASRPSSRRGRGRHPRRNGRRPPALRTAPRGCVVPEGAVSRGGEVVVDPASFLTPLTHDAGARRRSRRTLGAGDADPVACAGFSVSPRAMDSGPAVPLANANQGAVGGHRVLGAAWSTAPRSRLRRCGDRSRAWVALRARRARRRVRARCSGVRCASTALRRSGPRSTLRRTARCLLYDLARQGW